MLSHFTTTESSCSDLLVHVTPGPMMTGPPPRAPLRKGLHLGVSSIAILQPLRVAALVYWFL